MTDKKRYPREAALEVAREIHKLLEPFCAACKVVGSLRRYRSHVGDIELLFVPTFIEEADGLFDKRKVSLAHNAIAQLLASGVIAKRKNVNGSEMWGDKNMLGLHVASGIPVDFFATTEANWWNSLVCRTGGKANNLAITMAANKRGWRFNAYGSGFTRLDGSETYQTTSERDVFRFVGLAYVEPQYRA